MCESGAQSVGIARIVREWCAIYRNSAYCARVDCTVDLVIDGQTAWKKRFEVDFEGPICPFGCECMYKPSYSVDKQRLHAHGHKMLAGIFMGYVQHVHI